MSAPTTDFELLQRWAQGHQPAGNELVARHYASVRRFFEIKLTHAAEDLTQRTFLACLEGLGRQKIHTSFRAYLFGIARNQMLMHLRRSDRLDSLRTFQDESEGPARGTSLTGVFARSQEHHLLLRAMVALPPDLQMVVQLYYWENMRTAEIGEALGIPASTVTTRLARARQLLKQQIGQMRVPAALHGAVVQNLEALTRSLVDSGSRAGPKPSGR